MNLEGLKGLLIFPRNKPGYLTIAMTCYHTRDTPFLTQLIYVLPDFLPDFKNMRRYVHHRCRHHNRVPKVIVDFICDLSNVGHPLLLFSFDFLQKLVTPAQHPLKFYYLYPVLLQRLFFYFMLAFKLLYF